MAPRETRIEAGTPFAPMKAEQAAKLLASLPKAAETKAAAADAPKDWPLELSAKLFYKRDWGFNSGKKAPPENVYVRGAKVELRITKAGSAAPVVHATTHVTDDGKVSFANVPTSSAAVLRIHLEDGGGAVVVKGKSNAAHTPEFSVQAGKVVWHELKLDLAKAKGCGGRLDLGALEITHAEFRDLCDAYRSIKHAHRRVKEDLVGATPPTLTLQYPEPTTGISHVDSSNGVMALLKDDLRDRDVIGHEYGHFVQLKFFGTLDSPAGYDYGDDASEQHSPESEEHYESSWAEGFGTFFSCAMSADPVYHDGYDTSLHLNLATSTIKVGPHCEGSIQAALWRIWNVHGVKFSTMWKAFKSATPRKVYTVFDFYDAWKALKLEGLEHVVEALTRFGMEYGYRYEKGFTCDAAAKAPDAASKSFATVEALWTAFGKTGGGTKAQYFEEFYNRNRSFNAGALAAGSTSAAPKVTAGRSYLVPVRFKISAT